MTNANYEAAMTRALELALLGPAFGVNPQVGAVILNATGEIVAEGWHQGSGTDHAEVAALKNLIQNGQSAAGLTAVVTLEPCNHTGVTGPCAQALIEAGIARVIYASSDPGDASGGGAETLKNAGIEVIAGVLKNQADDQNRVWLTSAKLGRPYVTLKWASSLDGRSAAADGTSKWISGSESRIDAHRRRSELDAILVGTSTVIKDNPELTARKPDGSLYEHQPLRVVLGETDLGTDYRIFNDDAPTVQYRTHSIHGILAELKARGAKHLMVEGGPKVASAFIKLNLVDEFITYLAPMLIGGPRTSVSEIAVGTMAEAKELSFVEVKPLGQDLLIRSVPKGN